MMHGKRKNTTLLLSHSTTKTSFCSKVNDGATVSLQLMIHMIFRPLTETSPAIFFIEQAADHLLWPQNILLYDISI